MGKYQDVSLRHSVFPPMTSDVGSRATVLFPLRQVLYTKVIELNLDIRIEKDLIPGQMAVEHSKAARKPQTKHKLCDCVRFRRRSPAPGIAANKSLAAHDYKLSGDQSNANAQFSYGVMLAKGDGTAMNKSLAAHYCRLSADQGNAYAQLNYGVMLASRDGIVMHKSLAAHYFKLSADAGFVQAQYLYAKCLLNGIGVEKEEQTGVEYLRCAADQRLISAQIEYADWIFRRCQIFGPVERRKYEQCLRMAVYQGDSRAQMRLGIALMSGLLGRFDFCEARRFFELASKSKPGSNTCRFASILRDSLSTSACDMVNTSDFSARSSIFSFLRSSADESLPLIQILNAHLCDQIQSRDAIFWAWQEIARFSLGYLIDLSQAEPKSDRRTESQFLGSLPTDLLSCKAIREMIPLIFKMYSIECSLYKNVNHFLRCFPIVMVGKFMKELGGIFRYIYLLQSSIEYCARTKPLASDMIIYRGIRQNGRVLAPLYESMIGEVIVWPGFASTSPDRQLVISKFITNEDCLLFEIHLHPGDVAVAIHDYSEYRYESEVLIAASSGFMVDKVEWIDLRWTSESAPCELSIPQVRLTYCLSWYDFNIDDPPAPILV